MPRIGDYLIAEQLSRAERVGDYLTSQQLSRSERVGEYFTSQMFGQAKLGNYLTTEQMKGSYKIESGMNGLGCACKGMRGMGAVTCGGECGERIYDDPDRQRRSTKVTVGDPVGPLVNAGPTTSTDQGPENNDWAVDGMGAWADFTDTQKYVVYGGLAVAGWWLLLGGGVAVLKKMGKI